MCTLVCFGDCSPFSCSALPCAAPLCLRRRIPPSLVPVFGLRFTATALRDFEMRTPVFGGSFRTVAFQAGIFDQALAWLRDNTEPDSTLAVLPEGSILIVLSGRSNPTPYVSLEEQALPRYDKTALLTAYSNHPPDTLVLVTKLDSPRFGIDYAQDLMASLDPLYTPVLTLFLPTAFGHVPFLLAATRDPASSRQ